MGIIALKKSITMINKSKVTDLIAILLILAAYLSPEPYHKILLFTGLFALSGAITNQLAIHMLFEKVPLLYGSGVIEKNFERFKESIRSMIMLQFFTKDKLDDFFQNEEQKMDLSPLVESADFTPAFDALSQSIMESKFGSMVQMLGGESALEPLRESFSAKLKGAVSSIVSSDTFRTQLDHHLVHSSLSGDLIDRIDILVTKRLEELSPKMVKDLVQDLIHEHLGWLVVWGGIFGGLIGLVSSFFV